MHGALESLAQRIATTFLASWHVLVVGQGRINQMPTWQRVDTFGDVSTRNGDNDTAI